MIFASSLFLFLFLPLTLSGYFLVRSDLRNTFLLMMSLVFYAWGEPIYVLLMIGSIVMNYTTGVLLHLQRQRPVKFLTELRILLACIAGNLGLLFFFKYANFFMNNLNMILRFLAVKPIAHSEISLPLGISFFTFHAISYVVDVYRGKTDAQLNPIDCGLYLALFPQLIAGPIIRYHDIADQLASRTLSRRQFSSGIQRFIFGLAKKTMLANPLGGVADNIFSIPGNQLATGTAWLGIVCYTLQIYFDFSGYSDMAIGLGRMFGFEFFENFNYPYIARSIREFWRRWHISLSTWFRDYLYIPLGGNRGSAFRTYLNLWIVFLLCGFWHGASWNFVIWGALHGALLVIERNGWGRYIARLWRPLQHVYTLLLVMIGWVFFRSESLTYALQYLASILGITHPNSARYYALFYLDLQTSLTLLVAIIAATPFSVWAGKQLEDRLLSSRFVILRFSFYAGYYSILVALFVLSAASLAGGTYNPFIYYRF